jgi:thioredoxin-dependent peroxiredoxin
MNNRRDRSPLVLALTLALLTGGAGSLVACGGASRPDGQAGLLPAGSAAPDLSAPDQTGKVRRIAEEKGHPLVVYFYPKDGTPGCTKEACAFRDAWDRYKQAGVEIFGVSADDQKSHEQFAKEQHLPFPIVADPQHAWSTAFGVSTKLGMDSRVSFLIDPSGKVARVYPKVDPALHADDVLKDAAALMPASGHAGGAVPAPASSGASAPSP